jgi:hypothetical protein
MAEAPSRMPASMAMKMVSCIYGYCTIRRHINLFIIASLIRLISLIAQNIPVKTIATGKPNMGLLRPHGDFGPEFGGKASVTFRRSGLRSSQRPSACPPTSRALEGSAANARRRKRSLPGFCHPV